MGERGEREKMEKYRTLKTAMGRKYRVRMTPGEIADRWLYRAAITLVPAAWLIIAFTLWLRG